MQTTMAGRRHRVVVVETVVRFSSVAVAVAAAKEGPSRVYHFHLHLPLLHTLDRVNVARGEILGTVRPSRLLPRMN